MISLMSRVAAIPAWATLTALVVASTLLRFWAGTRVSTPWINPDEIIYGESAKSLYRDGSFQILGQHLSFLSFVYPALVGPLLVRADLERAYQWTKLLQALVMSLTAVPVYLWARELGARGWAFVAPLLTLALPGLAYSGLLMTEVAFYPVVVLAAWAMARALAEPTARRQAAVVLVVTAAALTRLQAFVLVPAFVTALLLFRVRREELRRLLPVLVGLIGVSIAWAGISLRHGGPLSRVFAGYEPAGRVHYALEDGFRFTAWHAADIVLFTGLLPPCALLLLWSTRTKRRALRAYLAVATAFLLWFVVEVGVFASEQIGYLAERNMMPLAPIVFVGFAAWLARAAPRPNLPMAVVVTGVVALVVYLPVKRLATSEAFPDSFTLLPFIKLSTQRPRADVDLLLAAIALAALVLFVVIPPRMIWLLPALVALAFTAESVWASREIADRAAFLQLMSTGADRRWIDHAAAGPTAFLYIGEFNWPGVWENAFWNRRVVRAYDLLSAQIPGGLPQESVRPLSDGRLVLTNGRPAEAKYVVAQYPLEFAGRPIATAGDGLVLWQLAQPMRLSVWTQRGQGLVHVLVYACAPGRLRLRIASGSAGVATILVNHRRFRTLRLAPHAVWRGSVPMTPRGPLRGATCALDVETGPELEVLQAKFLRAQRGVAAASSAS
jgi:Dolichyl-phosphate-mannose-protein mannosyltransferase